MTRYSVQPRHRISVKGYGFLSFSKSMGKLIGKNISKNLSGKYRQKLLHHAKTSDTNAHKLPSKKVVHKIAEGTGDLTDNKFDNKITKVPENVPQNKSEIVKSEAKIPKEIHPQKNDWKLLMI